MVICNFERENLLKGDVVADFFDLIAQRSGTEIPWEPVDRTYNISFPGAVAAWFLLSNNDMPLEVSNDAATGPVRASGVNARKRTIDLLRQSDEVMSLPPFRITDEVVANYLRSTSADSIRWLNQVHLRDQMPFPEPTDMEFPEPDEMYCRIRDMVLRYLTPEAVGAIGRALLRPPQGA